MQNQVIQMMLNQLKQKNPQMFQMVDTAMKNNGNPMEIFKQVTNNYSPEQMQSFLERAKKMGIPDEVLQQAQSGIKPQA